MNDTAVISGKVFQIVTTTCHEKYEPDKQDGLPISVGQPTSPL